MSIPAPRLAPAADVLEMLAMPAWQLSADGAGACFNTAFRSFTGADHRSLFGQGWRTALHPDDAANWLQRLQEASQRGGGIDLRLRNAAGDYRCLRLSTLGLDARLLTVCGVDVTDLVEAHAHATQELTLQRQIFDQIPAFIVVKDADNNVLRSNRRADTYFGGSEKSMEGHNTYDLFPDAVARAWHIQDRAVIESGVPLLGLVEELNVHGHSRWHRMDKVPFKRSRDGATLSLVLGVEISDTKMLELRLREQIEDSEALVRVLRQREYEQNLILDNRILRANRYAADFIGTAVTEIEGRHASMSLPNEAAALYLHDLDVLRSRQPKTNVVESITTRRGERRWLRLHHLPCFDATGALTRIMVVGDDITVARRLESQLHERVTQAEALVSELEQRNAEQQLIFDRIPARIVYKDTHNRVLRASRFAAEMIGLRLDQYEGHDLRDIYGERAAHYYADDLEVIRTGRPLSNLIERLDVPDGVRWVRTERIPSKNEAGEVTGIIVLSHDITAEKQAEEELRRQRTELQLILDHSPAAIMFRDGDGKVLRVNRTCAMRMGLSEGEIVGRNIRDLFGPAAEAWIAEGREVMRSGRSLRKWNVQYSHLVDNSCWHTETVPFYDERGIAAGVVVMAHDMTEQKLTEDELRHQKEEMAIILDHVPSMIIVKDGQNNLLRVNRAAAERFGRRVEDLIGTPSEEVFPDPEGRFWQEDLNIMRNRRPRFDLKAEFPKADGPPLWLRYHKVPYFDAAGQAIGVIAIAEDITADIQAKQALEHALVLARHHEHELHTLFDSLPICVVFKDCDNHILRANRFAAEFFRIPQAELVGRDIGELVLGEEVDYRVSDREVLKTGVPNLDNVHELPLADGRRLLVRSHKMRYHDADGKVVGLLVAFQELHDTRRQGAGA
jgi:PAS domain S-box-containing protein